MLCEKILIEIIDEFMTALKANRALTNFDLINMCEEKGLGIIDKKTNSHLAHELLEVAINLHIVENYQQTSLKTASDSTEVLKDLADLEKSLPPQSWRAEEQIIFQQFSTPPRIAFLMAKLLNPNQDELILEPSAGTGSLAVWLKIAGCRFHLNELSEVRRILLELQGFDATAVNAEFISDLLPDEIIPDGILMNPPFSANAGRTKIGDSNFGFRHITSALERLKPGGRLVALFGRDALLKTNKGLKFLNTLSENYDLKAVLNLPENAYYKYGTTLPMTVLCLAKNELGKPLHKVTKINCAKLEDILSITKIFD